MMMLPKSNPPNSSPSSSSSDNLQSECKDAIEQKRINTEKLFKTAGKGIADFFCKSLHTKDGLNLEDLFKKTIANTVVKILNEPNGKFQSSVNGIIFNELSDYSTNLFDTAIGDGDSVPNFTLRVLRSCFATENSIIPGLLDEAIKGLNQTQLNAGNIMAKMAENIQKMLNGGNTSIFEQDATNDPTNTGSTSSILEDDSNTIPKFEVKGVMSEDVTKYICDINTSLINGGKTLIEMILHSQSFKENMENSITSIFETFLKNKSDDLFNEILNGVKLGSDEFLNNNIIKLHILYLILTNNETEKPPSGGWFNFQSKKESKNSRYYIGHQIFQDALSDFIKGNTSDTKSFTDILNNKLLIKLASNGEVIQGIISLVPGTYGGSIKRKTKARKTKARKTKARKTKSRRMLKRK